MACFIVPAAEAVITTVAEKVIASKENNVTLPETEVTESKIKFSTKLGWLNKLLWGGSALLAFEHVWHGEVIFSFPFLTAVQNGETADMLAEMGTAGVTMAVLVTLIWGGMVVASSFIEKKAAKDKEILEGEE